MKYTYLLMSLILLLIIFVSGCAQQQKQLPPLNPSDIEIVDARFGGEVDCEKIQNNPEQQTYFRQMYMDVKINVPSIVMSEVNALTANVFCQKYVDSKSLDSQGSGVQLRDGLNNDILFSTEVYGFDTRQSHSLQICCKGSWEDKIEPTACQSYVVDKVC